MTSDNNTTTLCKNARLKPVGGAGAAGALGALVLALRAAMASLRLAARKEDAIPVWRDLIRKLDWHTKCTPGWCMCGPVVCVAGVVYRVARVAVVVGKSKVHGSRSTPNPRPDEPQTNPPAIRQKACDRSCIYIYVHTLVRSILFVWKRACCIHTP